jgi:mutator protein MutT
MPFQPIAIAVVESEGQFLIGLRPEGVPLAGLWEFPGGKVQENEEAAVAAVRECLEETGLEVEVIGEYAVQQETYSHGTVRLRFFACRRIGKASVALAPFRWVPREELGKYDFPSGNRALLKQLTAVM